MNSSMFDFNLITFIYSSHSERLSKVDLIKKEMKTLLIFYQLEDIITNQVGYKERLELCVHLSDYLGPQSIAKENPLTTTLGEGTKLSLRTKNILGRVISASRYILFTQRKHALSKTIAISLKDIQQALHIDRRCQQPLVAEVAVAQASEKYRQCWTSQLSLDLRNKSVFRHSRDGLVIKRTCCSSRGPELSSQHPRQVIPNNSNSRASNTLFWPPWTTGLIEHTQRKTHMYRHG